jgi:hypothetical protein
MVRKEVPAAIKTFRRSRVHERPSNLIRKLVSHDVVHVVYVCNGTCYLFAWFQSFMDNPELPNHMAHERCVQKSVPGQIWMLCARQLFGQLTSSLHMDLFPPAFPRNLILIPWPRSHSSLLSTTKRRVVRLRKIKTSWMLHSDVPATMRAGVYYVQFLCNIVDDTRLAHRWYLADTRVIMG